MRLPFDIYTENNIINTEVAFMNNREGEDLIPYVMTSKN